MRRLATVLLACVLIGAPAPEAGRRSKGKQADKPGLRPERWLVLGPVAHPLPVFAEEPRGRYDLQRLLDESELEVLELAPREESTVAWFTGESLRWQSRGADAAGLVALTAPDSAVPAVAWLAAWLATDRFVEAELELLGGHARRAWLDGRPVASGGGAAPKDAGATDAEPTPVKAKLALTPGTHLLLLRTVRDPQRDAPWLVGARLVAEGNAPRVSASIDPARDLDISDITDPPEITDLALGPRGILVAAKLRRIVPGTHDREHWVELYNSWTGIRAETWRAQREFKALAWSPDNAYISYILDDDPSTKGGKDKDKKTATLYLADRTGRTIRPLLERVEGLEGYLWSPDSRRIAYWVKEEADKDERGIKRLEGLMDRWAGYRDKRHVYLVSVADGARRRLTAGGLGAPARDFSPDSRRLLVSRTVEDLTERPYSRDELWEIDLSGIKPRKLGDFHWLGTAQYSPDGTRLLLATGADAFGGVGSDLPEGLMPNLYDGQLFLWDPASGEVDPITRDFDPDVEQAHWARFDGHVYLRARDGDRVRLFRYDVRARTFTVLETGLEVLDDFQIGLDVPVAVALGSSPWEPQGLVGMNLETDAVRGLTQPAQARFVDIRRGRVEPWSFTAPSGREIDGRVYLPPDFDATRKYPCIVYYYGGTNPVDREFGGRYPKEWWAARGYVVYVLQPSGATGFGQAHSALHVNDWGRTTAQEIIEGTREFLEAHPFVDRERVGAIGASYGGFMTMLLATQTDLFAAAVSHAGISSIASYWGEGWWGYAYSAVATADSFPWNRPEIYVEQSPLFRADRARVPLLLTHGRADTNVPVGESDQFYVALKLLGHPVEYLQVEGEDHWILTHEKRQLWSRAILAWFDRWLRDRPEWWEHLFPEKGKEK